MTFSSLKLDRRLLRAIQDLGFTEPTPIQRDAIPPALSGMDVLACAQTGSGKTAAFVLPILERVLRSRPGATRALVITPTRELAAQIEDHICDLARYVKVESTAVHGGVGMEPQTRALRAGADIVVATPGRLLDHMQRGNARFDDLEILVLDEADRMLDMGFMPDVRRILRQLPTDRQTLFFSATIPSAVAALSRSMLHEPVTIDIERPAAPAAGVSHFAYPVDAHQKTSLLVELLRSRADMRSVLVFTRTRIRAERVAEYLDHQDISVTEIHGDRSQPERTRALDGFKAGRFRVLVATDIAARGIDVTDLSHVVNFDVPEATDDYIHRVGRTARAGGVGEALTFVAMDEERELRSIERVIGARMPRVAVGSLTDSWRCVERAKPCTPAGLNGNRRLLSGGRRSRAS